MGFEPYVKYVAGRKTCHVFQQTVAAAPKIKQLLKACKKWLSARLSIGYVSSIWGCKQHLGLRLGILEWFSGPGEMIMIYNDYNGSNMFQHVRFCC